MGGERHRVSWLWEWPACRGASRTLLDGQWVRRKSFPRTEGGGSTVALAKRESGLWSRVGSMARTVDVGKTSVVAPGIGPAWLLTLQAMGGKTTRVRSYG